jgi:hypothetical protein
MSKSSDIRDNWRAIIDGAPGARQGDPRILRAAFEHPVLSRLYPVPTHGTLRFCRTVPSLPPVEPDEELPFIDCEGPRYLIYTPGYVHLIGEADTPAAAAALLAAALSGADTAH